MGTGRIVHYRQVVVHVDVDRVAPRLQRGTRWAAELERVVALEPQAREGEIVQRGRLDLGVPKAHAVPAEIVEDDHDDVRPRAEPRVGCGRHGRGEQQRKPRPRDKIMTSDYITILNHIESACFCLSRVYHKTIACESDSGL